MCINTLRHKGHLQKREALACVTGPVNKREGGKRQARKTGNRSCKVLVKHAKDLEHHPMRNGKPLKGFKEENDKIKFSLKKKKLTILAM